LQTRTLQESLANAKVSVGQDCVYEGHLAKKSTANERKEHNIEKYIQLLTTFSLTILLFIRSAVVASEICEILWKFELIQFKVIQGHQSWCQSKAHMQLPISHYFGRISYSFRDIDAFSFKIACFPTPPLFNAASQYHNIIYTSLKSTFSWLQFCRTHHGSITSFV